MTRLFISLPVCGGGLTLMAVALLAISGCVTSGHATSAAEPTAQEPPIASGDTSAFQPVAVGSPLSPPLQEDADELIRDLSLEGQARRAASDHAARAGRKLMNELRYREAEDRLHEAVRLDSGNDEARRLLQEVLFILGDRSGTIPTFKRAEAERAKVRQRQAQFELQRMYAEGLQQMNDAEFDTARRTFSQVLERIKWFPYMLDLTDLKVKAEKKLNLAEEEARNSYSLIRSRQESAARSEQQVELETSLRRVQVRIDQLLKSARRAYHDRRYGRAAGLFEEVIRYDHDNREANRMFRKSTRLEQLHRDVQTSMRSDREWEATFLSQLEQSIPYNRIFNFPTRTAWDQISRKEVSLTARISGGESSQARTIRADLERLPITVEFDDVAFEEVIDFLQSASGINFVLTKGARDVLADSEDLVNLAHVKDLPLKNILRLVLDSRDPVFNYVIKDGAVLIGPSDSIRDDVYLEFYEVSDITRDHPDFPAPRLALEAEGGDGGGGSSSIIVLDDDDEGTGSVTVEADALVELLEETLWQGEQPDEESVEYQNGKLVCRTTLANHQKIGQLLNALRKSTGIMVTVESRFVDLQNNFLEEIGINFGNPTTTNLPNPINDIDGAGTQLSAGFEAVDSSGTMDVRATVFNAFSLPIGSSVAPFELSNSGGFALQYNVLDRYIMEAVLEAVSKTQEFKRLNAPRVTAFNTQISHSLVIDQAAYIKDAEVNQTGVVPVINPVIGVLNSGSILQVRPTVSYDRKYINLEIQPTLATQLPSRFKRLILGLTDLTIEFPVLSVTQIKTTVTIPDGGTVLVGGLNRSISQRNRSGVPMLSRLPGLDILLGRKGSSSLMSTLYVLINAKITIIREEEARQFN